ncbi:hypothetical protein [Sansalvadorimonas verongulae]|uniref:hypothetical protein n=1 Tax=Sansalvadorimonas verongulae TaxID=2172824 RepID=UPI0012BC2D89|nr:hypothetical protein [Sansalvadorimonas verongulae]MTI13818.1 hypothetical protein [Sansalvadorimonas verongulae]
MSIEWDIEELAYRAMGKTEEETEQAINDGDIDEALHGKYQVSFEQFSKIVKDLLPFTPQVQAGITGELFHAFVDVKAQRAIVKGQVKEKVA